MKAAATIAYLATALVAFSNAQNVGTNTAEVHPSLQTQTCTSSGCTTENTKIVLDANWRWTHNVGGSTNCYTGNKWDATLCPDPATCSKNCALDGADYSGTYGITTSGNTVSLKLVTKGPYSTNVGSRIYLLQDDNTYKIYKLLNKEFTFDVDASQLPCGLNGALYFVQMDQDGGKSKYTSNKAGAAYGTGYCDAQCPHDIKFINGEANVKNWVPSTGDPNAGSGRCGSLATSLRYERCFMDQDGGMSKYPTNKAGAAYGTGYCDAQCPHDIKFINGEANVKNWVPSTGDPNAGSGQYGSCCAEMDIWESNSISQAYTSHPCTVTGQYRCSSPTECGDDATGNRFDGVCDKDGCDFNPYRLNNHTFYGPGSNFNVDSTKPVTVVTQFITDDGTDNGNLVEIKRFFVQNGKAIDNSAINWSGIDATNSITDKVCNQAKTVFGDTNDHSKKGGLKAMGDALKKGVVLTMSLWVDYAANCLWLDSTYPTNKSPSVPGAARGTCPTTSGVPADVLAQVPGATVKYGNIKVGALGTTTGGVKPPTTGPTSAPSNTPSTSAPTTRPTSAPSTSAPTTRPTSAPSTSAPSSGAVGAWGQCGGNGYSGPTTCVSGYTCKSYSEWYSQCIPN
ncbi:unnamed protein product [Aphanomyces euteiches]